MKEFIDFLEEYKVLEEFKYNLVNGVDPYEDSLPEYDTIESLCNCVEPFRYFWDAFQWSETDAGHEFWNKLSASWVETINGD